MKIELKISKDELKAKLGVKDGEQGSPGPAGPAGPAGKTPERGVDFMTSDDISRIAHEVTTRLPDTGTSKVIFDQLTGQELAEKLKGHFSYDDLTDKPTFRPAHSTSTSDPLRMGGTGYLREITDVQITNPTNGQVLKYQATTKTWVNGTDTAGAPAGSDTWIQYNQGGTSFGADANLTWDYTNKKLLVTGQYSAAKYSATGVVNWNNSNVQRIDLVSGSNAVTFGNPVDGARYILILKQPAAGAAGTVSWPGSITWVPNGTAPTLQTTNGNVDTISFIYDGTAGVYYGNYSSAITFSTGLTNTNGVITVNTSQNIAKLTNLTTNGFVKTTGGDGTLTIDTNTYLTGNQTITLFGDVTGSGTTSITATVIQSPKLTTARNLWGQSFDGTANVNGSIINNTDNTADLGSSSTRWANTYGTNGNYIATLTTVTVPAFSGSSGTNWTFGTGWTTPITGSTLDKSAGGTGTMTPSGTFTISVGVTYKVVIVSTTSPTTGTFAGNFTYTLGGTPGKTISSATTTTEYITAETTGKIIITPSNTSRFGITSITVQAMTDATGDLTVDGNLNVRSPATFSSDIQLATASSALKLWNGTTYVKALYGSAVNNNWYIGGAGNTAATTTNNVGIGAGVLASVTNSAGAEGSYNVGIGFQAMPSTTTGHDNFALGAFALWQNSAGSTNTAIGSNAMIVNTTGNFNVGIGYQALGGSRTSLYNTAIGTQAGANYTFNGLNSNGLNTFIGALAGFGTAATTVGTVTITIASPAVLTKTAHGLVANDRVQFSTTGSLPTGISAGGIYFVIAAGLTADNFEISTTLGGAAINTSGTQSGTHTCYKVFSTGKQETFIGSQAGYDFTSGDNNSYVGYNTGRGVTTGSGNTILGAQVTGLAAGLTNNIILANGTGAIKAQHDGTDWTFTGKATFTGTIITRAGTATAGTAPFVMASGTLLTVPVAGTVEFLTDAYYATTTTGAVRRMFVMGNTGRATGQTAANASVATYTLGATDASYEVSANVLVTTSSAENFTVTVDYTDEGNTARTVTLNFQTIAGVIGTAINFANGAVPYEGIPLHLRVKASTAITVKTTGTFTGATYNVEGIIKQTA